MGVITVTKIQFDICQKYLKGHLKNEDMYILFKTYLNEYISLFSWDSWKNDSIDKILSNFCNAVVCKNIKENKK